MAINPPQDYGLDVACVTDADDLFTEAEGIDVLIQDCLHALTQDDFLGPGGDGRGYDVRKLIGAKDDALQGIEPTLVEVLERDDRIDSARVQLTATKSNGLSDITIRVSGDSALGPFDFTRSVLEVTSAFLEDTDR